MGEEPLELGAQTTPSLGLEGQGRPPCPQRLPVVDAAEVPGDPRLVISAAVTWVCGLASGQFALHRQDPRWFLCSVQTLVRAGLSLSDPLTPSPLSALSARQACWSPS